MTIHQTSRPTPDWLPTFCPSWCDQTHAKVLAEPGDAESVRAHFRTAGEGYLSELRKPRRQADHA